MGSGDDIFGADSGEDYHADHADQAEEDMCGGGEGGESESSPDICIERKYLAAAWRSCSLSSAVCRLNRVNMD